MNEFVIAVVGILLVAMVGYDKFKRVKESKAFKAAQDKIKDQISALEAQLAALRK